MLTWKDEGVKVMLQLKQQLLDTVFVYFNEFIKFLINILLKKSLVQPPVQGCHLQTDKSSKILNL